MPDPIDERRSPMTPQMALRVAIVGSIVLALFAILFFRLWFLQVLSGTQYVAQAQVNRVRDVTIPAQRGRILDRNGAVLVSSTKALSVQIVPTRLPVKMSLANIRTPPHADEVVFDRLARVLGMKTARRRCTIAASTQRHPRLSPIACEVAQQLSLQPFGDVTVKANTSKYVEYYVAERQNEYPGVQVQQTWITGYPQGTLAAQVLGTVGQISPEELKGGRYPGAVQGEVVGQSGLEAEYDQFLRGTDGEQKVEIDADGLPTGIGKTVQPIAGHSLQTSLDQQVQRVGQNALAQSIAQNAGDGGAFVAMDPDNGEIYAMGSNPSFDPSVLTGQISQKAYDRDFGPGSNDPLLNRAIESDGPTGSNFKPITATAALESGLWNVDKVYDDTGKFCVGSGASQECRQNSGGAAYGPVNLVSAIKVSDDNFFYNLGNILNANPITHPIGGPLQTWARKFGIGRNPGIDLPGAVSGTLPDPRWRNQRNEEEYECENATGPFRYTNPSGTETSAHMHKGWHRSAKHPLSAGGCGIADGNPWTEGDNINLAVGQGDVQVSPLQLAVVYSALANGGTIVTPHIGLNVENADGTVLQKVGPEPPKRKLNIDPFYLDTILQGLHEAAQTTGGTSDDVMGNFPETVYGKTGTAQYGTVGVNETDYAWYSCFVPATATSKPIEVTVWVEKGGFGDTAAAPVAREILSQWFFGKPGAYKAGSSADL
jgi:penicillin-binding protein 2